MRSTATPIDQVGLGEREKVQRPFLASLRRNSPRFLGHPEEKPAVSRGFLKNIWVLASL